MGQNTHVAIIGLTPILFDASGSTGEGISYVIGFGDGGWSQNPWEVHIETAGILPTATATVQDRFGRSSTVSRQFSVFAMDTPSGTAWVPYSLTDCARGNLDSVTQVGVSIDSRSY